MSDLPNCEGDLRFTETVEDGRWRVIMARIVKERQRLADATCPGCPVFAACEAGKDGDDYWIIRAGTARGNPTESTRKRYRTARRRREKRDALGLSSSTVRERMSPKGRRESPDHDERNGHDHHQVA